MVTRYAFLGHVVRWNSLEKNVITMKVYAARYRRSQQMEKMSEGLAN